MKKSSVDMTSGPLLKNIVLFAIPVMLGGWMQTLFHTADVIVIGQFCGSASLGAMGATSAISTLITSLFMGLSVGVSVTVSNAAGSGDQGMIRKAVHTAVVAALLGGLCIAAIGIPLAKTLLRMMSTPESVIDLAAVYMRIILGGSIFSLVYNFGASILRAMGESKKPLYFISISGALNVVLNLFFVLVFKMDVAGVALATVLSNGLSAFLVIRSLVRRSDACKLYIRELKIDKQPFKKILRIGIPAGIQSSLFSISNVMIQSSVNSFGEAMMSANTAGGNINSFMNIAVTGFCTAAINFVGQNMGAQKYKRVRKVIKICFLISLTLGIVLGVATSVFGRPLLGIYITDSAQAIAYGITRLKYMSLPYVFFAGYDVLASSLRGLGRSTLAMIMSLIGICFSRIIWIYAVLPLHRTPEVLYLSYPVSWAITMAAFAVCVISTLRKLPDTDREIQA